MNVPIEDILAGTPSWVFLLLAYLVWRSLFRLRPRVMPQPRVWVMPGVFIAWGLVGLVDRPGAPSLVLLHWVAGAVVGLGLGLLSSMTVVVDRERQLVRLPGSVMPLVRILVIFGAHYLLNVAAVLHPADHDTYMGWDIVVSGASAGYFIGWGIRFVQACRRAPQAPLQTSRDARRVRDASGA